MVEKKATKKKTKAVKKKTIKKKPAEKQFVTKDMSIHECVARYPETHYVFMQHGMHCVGCMAGQFETIEEGCLAHGKDPEEIVKDINEFIKRMKEKDKAEKKEAKKE